MATYDSLALGALPVLILFFQELSDAILPDAFEILDHTHSKMSSVALADMLKPCAGEVAAFVTILHLTPQEPFACFFKEGALLVCRPATNAVRHSDTLVFYVVLACLPATVSIFPN